MVVHIIFNILKNGALILDLSPRAIESPGFGKSQIGSRRGNI
jgi:hypothetical protein